MPDKKKQHYIPQFYMKNFSANKVISVFNIKDKKIITNAPYKNQCYKDYFYGKDNFWENYLAEKENAWSEAIHSVLAEQALTEEIITLLKEFALFQYMRTSAMDAYRKQERLESIIEIGKQIYFHRGWNFDDAALKECEEYAKQKATPIENLQLAKETQKYISDLSVLVISYSNKNKLISSDMPVLAINPFHFSSVGLAMMGLLMFFPVSPTKLVVLYDSKMYPKYKGQYYITLNNENEVINLNAYQLVSAENILFGIDSYEFTMIKKAHWDARNKNRKINPISTLGPEGKKLIISRTRPNYFSCNLSFGKINSSFEKIPFPCREPIFRQWDKKCEEKLIMKGKIIPQVVEFKHQYFNQMNLTKKEYVKQCCMMYKLAKMYWNNNL